MIFALPSSPHWAPTTTVTGTCADSNRHQLSRELGGSTSQRARCQTPQAVSDTGGALGTVTPVAVMRIRRWDAMSEDDRSELIARGLDAIFDPTLRVSIGELIEDVRARGDAAVCDALARFDGIDVSPDGLRVTDDELDSAHVDDDVDRAVDDAIDHLRA